MKVGNLEGQIQDLYQVIYDNEILGAYLTIPDHADWDIAGSNADNWTIEVWTKHDNHSGAEYYIAQQDSTDNDNKWRLFHLHGSGIYFQVTSSGVEIITLGYAGEITDTNWHHIAVIKVANEWGLYKDGTQIAYDTTDSTDTFSAPISIGAREEGLSCFDGRMDELRIIQSNPFSGSPNSGLTDTITVPTSSHTSDSNTKLLLHFDNNFIDSGNTGHTVTNYDTTFSDTEYKFGNYSADFIGGGNTTSITISNLDGDLDDEYQLIVRSINGYNGGQSILCRINNDSSSIYAVQELAGESTTASATRRTAETFWRLGDHLTLGDISFSETHIHSQSDYERTMVQLRASSISGTTVTNIKDTGGVWNDTSTKITSLVIYANQSNGLKIGTRVILLKKVKITGLSHTKTGELDVRGRVSNAWQKIYETDIATAVSQFDITGLDGDSDIIYKLITRFKSDTASGTNYYCVPNNASDSVFGEQTVYGQNNVISASRPAGDRPAFIGANAGSGQLSMGETLIYAKSSYERTFLTVTGYGITGTTVDSLLIEGAVMNDISNNITSFRIKGNVADCIGIDSHIELWRLNL